MVFKLLGVRDLSNFRNPGQQSERVLQIVCGSIVSDGLQKPAFGISSNGLLVIAVERFSVDIRYVRVIVPPRWAALDSRVVLLSPLPPHEFVSRFVLLSPRWQ